MDQKLCTKCKKLKYLSEYSRCPTKIDKLQSQCKDCQKKATVVSTRKRVTGFSKEEYDYKFVEQKECCAICGKRQSQLKRALSADHCHTTGNKRGLLCVSCNTAIGKLNDDIQLLKNAINYLERYSK